LVLAEWIGSNQILLPDQSRGHCFLIGRGHCCFDWPQATHTKLLDFARAPLRGGWQVCGT